MLINKHDCYKVLFQLKSNGVDIHEDVTTLMSSDNIPKNVVSYLKETNYPTVAFYLNLNKKAHKIIKELLTCENKPISTYIKIATSLITQAVITIEHTCQNDMETQNQLIENLGLCQLSNSLAEYFQTGNSSSLVEAVMSNRRDVKVILDD